MSPAASVTPGSANREAKRPKDRLVSNETCCIAVLSRNRPETHLKQHMASFYIHDGAEALTLRITGPLTKGAAAELEQAWLTARSTLVGRELMVDLGDVASVGTDGKTLLRRLAGHGARFITSSRLTDSLAEEASRRMPETPASPTPQLVESARLLPEDLLRRREGVGETRSAVRTNCAKALVITTAAGSGIAPPHTFIACRPTPLGTKGWRLGLD